MTKTPTLFQRSGKFVNRKLSAGTQWVMTGEGELRLDDEHRDLVNNPPILDYDGIRQWFVDHPEVKGIVWVHSDGREVRLKRADFKKSDLMRPKAPKVPKVEEA